MARIQVQKGYMIAFTSTVDAGYGQKYQVSRRLIHESNNILLDEVAGWGHVSYEALGFNSVYEVVGLYDHDWQWHISDERASSNVDGLRITLGYNDSGGDQDFNDLIVTAVISKDPNYTGPYDPSYQNGLIHV